MFSSFTRSNAGQRLTHARLTVTALMMAGLTHAAHAQSRLGGVHTNGAIVPTVPEPSSWAAFVIGGVCVGVLFLARKARQRRETA